MRPKRDVETIYEASLDVFARFGYQKATIEDVAVRLGMTKGSLYTYVRNKEDLYHRTISYAFRKWQTAVETRVETERAADLRLVRLCETAVTYLQKEPRLREILRNDPEIFPMFPVKDPYRELNDISRKMIAEILALGMEQKVFTGVDTEKTAEIIFSIYKVFIIQSYVRTDEEYISRMFSQTMDLITRGLYSRGEAPE